VAEGWHGWDDYAAFYDWENARTVGRRDVAFWRALAARTKGRVLELGCGTGRVLLPVAREGGRVIGIDRSKPMLDRARRKLGRPATRTARTTIATGAVRLRASLVRGDIRELPWREATFGLVMAPYGILQSLTREKDLTQTLAAVHRVLAPGGRFGIDLVPDVPRWREYERRLTLRGTGPRGLPVQLVETVRQDPRRRITTFDQEFIEGRGKGRTSRAFSLSFRTLAIPALRRRLEAAGFEVDAVLGDYDGRPWDDRADTWVILARK
jgi:ubiquinone/menaquinone biosynthesis C-methylase UbiE